LAEWLAVSLALNLWGSSYASKSSSADPAMGISGFRTSGYTSPAALAAEG